MARLHQLVVAASETTNLMELATYLHEACQIVVASDDPTPHKNFAIRFISFQIAFAGDGDIQSGGAYYKSLLDFSIENITNDQPEGEAPSEPPRTTS